LSNRLVTTWNKVYSCESSLLHVRAGDHRAETIVAYHKTHSVQRSDTAGGTGYHVEQRYISRVDQVSELATVELDPSADVKQ